VHALQARLSNEVTTWLPKYVRRIKGGPGRVVRTRRTFLDTEEWTLLKQGVAQLRKSGKFERFAVRKGSPAPNSVVQALLNVHKDNTKLGNTQRVVSLSFSFNLQASSLRIVIEGEVVNSFGHKVFLTAVGRRQAKNTNPLARDPTPIRAPVLRLQ
jgi:hypothetical protein